MDFLLKLLAIYMYFNLMSRVLTYIYNENPKGYIAAVNNINAFPKNRISSYRKFFRAASFGNDKLSDRLAVDPTFKVPSSNVFAAVPARQSYVSPIRHTQAPRRQMKDLAQNLKDINKSWNTESVVNPKSNQTKLSGPPVNAQDKLFTPSRNLGSAQQKPSKTHDSLLPKRITNHISQLAKEDIPRTKNHKLIPTNTQLLEFTNKILHKTNVNERYPYARSLSRVDTLQKYMDTFPRHAEYKKRDAMRSKINGFQYPQHQIKKFDVEKYNPNDWEYHNGPLKVEEIEVVEKINKPYAVFDDINRDSFDSPTLLGQDGQRSLKAFAKLDNKYAKNENYIENIFLNPF